MASAESKPVAKASADKSATRKLTVVETLAQEASRNTTEISNMINKSLEAVLPGSAKFGSDLNGQANKVKEQVETNMKEFVEKNMKTVTDATEFAKGNLEALVESAKAAAKGAETLTSQFVEASKKSAEDAQAAFKVFTSAKTPNELLAAQNEFTKAQFDKVVQNVSQATEAWMKVAGEVVQPLSSRVAVAVESMKKAAAA